MTTGLLKIYLIHYRTLKFYMRLDMAVDKVLEVI